MTITTTTVELPRNLRFTVGDQPQPRFVDETPTAGPIARPAPRRRGTRIRDGVLALAVLGTSLALVLDLAGL